MKNIIKLLGFFVLLSLFACKNDTNTTPLERTKKPNIILLLADDMGYGELGCYGQEVIKTPFLDSLSTVGVKFNQFYANAVCSPSRAALMTGKHPGHASIRGNSAIGDNDLWYRKALKDNEQTIGEYLQSKGYKTGIIGKWHLENPRNLDTWAHSRGFDYTFHPQWDKFSYNPNNPPKKVIYRKGIPTHLDSLWKKEYVSIDDMRTDMGIEFIDKYQNDPFFLMMSYKIPHTPENDIYDDEIYAEKGWPEVERQHAGRITILDRLIKRLFNELDSKGMLENTLIVFTSDNGPHREGGHDPNFFNSNGDLRGYKRDLYEGGVRVPAIAYWKGKTSPKVTDHIATLWDLFPTFYDVVGEDEVPDSIDGISFLPEITGKGEQKKHDYLYWELQLTGWWKTLPTGGFRQALLKDNWKAVRYGVDEDIKLYNIKEDISEKKNVASKYPEKIKEMEKLFRASSTETVGFPYGGKKQNYKAANVYKRKR